MSILEFIAVTALALTSFVFGVLVHQNRLLRALLLSFLFRSRQFWKMLLFRHRPRQLVLNQEKGFPRADKKALWCVGELKQELVTVFGPKMIREVYLIGSRARGDHSYFSDTDVVVVQDGTAEKDLLRREIQRISFQLLLDKGIYIQPRVISEAWFGGEVCLRLKHTMQAIMCDGVAV